MKRRVLALVLFAAMIMALVPAASAQSAMYISNVTVYNVSSNSAYSYNPTNVGSKTYFEITAPYAQIATSSTSIFGNGPHYEVSFYLSETLDTLQDVVFINDKAITLNGTASEAGSYSNGVVKAIFTAKKGGNSEVISVRVLDRSAGTTATHSVQVRFIDQQYSGSGTVDSSQNMRDMTVRASGSDNYYTAQISGNTLYIDYNSLYILEGQYINVSFNFQDANGVAISQGYVSNVTSYGSVPLVNSFNYDRTSTPPRGQIGTSGVTLPITVNTSNLLFNMKIETPYSYYNSKNYNIVWRDTSKTSASNSVTVYPSRYVNMKIGESMTFTVNVVNSYVAGSGFSLDVGGTSGVVDTRTGTALNVKALRTGTTWLNLRNSKGHVLETIYVTVLDSFATGEGSTSTGSGASLYKVTANSLNVRSGPGASYSRLGSVKRNEQVTVESVANSWAKISWGTGYGYVSSSYLSYISSVGTGSVGSSSSSSNTGLLGGSSSNGNFVGYETSGSATLGSAGTIKVPPSGVPYIVMADSLNVYTSPGTQFPLISTLVKGDRVAVVSIDANGWAKIASWGEDVGYVLASSLIPQ